MAPLSPSKGNAINPKHHTPSLVQGYGSSDSESEGSDQVLSNTDPRRDDLHPLTKPSLSTVQAASTPGPARKTTGKRIFTVPTVEPLPNIQPENARDTPSTLFTAKKSSLVLPKPTAPPTSSSLRPSTASSLASNSQKAGGKSSSPAPPLNLFSFTDDFLLPSTTESVTVSHAPTIDPITPAHLNQGTGGNSQSTLGTPPHTESSSFGSTNKKRKYHYKEEEALISSGIKVHAVNVKEVLANEDLQKLSERMSSKTPIQEHLSASTKLSILSLAKKAVTQADDLEKMYASNRAKKRASAAKYGF